MKTLCCIFQIQPVNKLEQWPEPPLVSLVNIKLFPSTLLTWFLVSTKTVSFLCEVKYFHYMSLLPPPPQLPTQGCSTSGWRREMPPRLCHPSHPNKGCDPVGQAAGVWAPLFGNISGDKLPSLRQTEVKLFTGLVLSIDCQHIRFMGEIRCWLKGLASSWPLTRWDIGADTPWPPHPALWQLLAVDTWLETWEIKTSSPASWKLIG